MQIVAVNRETIKENLRGAGSFLIRTSDGKEYPVPHPEFVMIGRFNVVVEGRKGGISILDPQLKSTGSTSRISITPGSSGNSARTCFKIGATCVTPATKYHTWKR